MKRRKMFNLKCTKHSIFAIFPTYIMSTCYVAKCFSKLFKRKVGMCKLTHTGEISSYLWSPHILETELQTEFRFFPLHPI